MDLIELDGASSMRPSISDSGAGSMAASERSSSDTTAGDPTRRATRKPVPRSTTLPHSTACSWVLATTSPSRIERVVMDTVTEPAGASSPNRATSAWSPAGRSATHASARTRDSASISRPTASASARVWMGSRMNHRWPVRSSTVVTMPCLSTMRSSSGDSRSKSAGSRQRRGSLETSSACNASLVLMTRSPICAQARPAGARRPSSRRCAPDGPARSRVATGRSRPNAARSTASALND